MKTFDSAGTFTDAVSEGSVSVGTIAVGPTGWTYMGLSNPVNLSDTSSSGGTLCAFVRIREATGVPSCVDETVRSVSDIQFDNAGRVYYRGTNGSSSNVLRRYWDGVVTDLITSSATLSSYVALEDGTVVLSGSSAGTSWIRWLTTSLELRTIMNCSVSWLRQFPDGNVYFDTSGGADCQTGTRRFLGAEKQLDPVSWFRGSCTTGPGVTPSYDNNPAYFYGCHKWNPNDTIERIAGCEVSIPLPEYCGLYGASSFVVTQSGSVFALVGHTNRRLLKMWPVVSPATSSVARVTKLREAGNVFAITGTNTSGQNITTAYDPATDTERTLISPSTEVEIYNLAYSSSTGELFFDGLRFSNNTYVVGKVNVSSGAITYLGTTLTSFSDFQAF